MDTVKVDTGANLLECLIKAAALPTQIVQKQPTMLFDAVHLLWSVESNIEKCIRKFEPLIALKVFCQYDRTLM